MLIIKDTPYSTDKAFPDYPFELSDFQKHSIDAIDNSNHVLVCAPTSSGKTLVAEHKIRNRSKGKKIIYTTPIKALSNFIFNELTHKYPDISFGILTGDIKYNPDADCIVMTTEILRNLLYNKKIKTDKLQLTVELDVYTDVDAIIFDEVHYITNKERGRVWEESIILLPQHIQLIMLSATIERPELFGNWLSSIKTQDVTLAMTNKRIVPLKHYAFMGFLKSIDKLEKRDFKGIEAYDKTLVCIMDEHANFNPSIYDKIKELKKNYFKFISNKSIFNDLVQFLKIKDLLPTIIFTLSKKKCESYAKLVTVSVNDTTEQLESLAIFDKELRKSDHYEHLIKLDEYAKIKTLVQKGIAYHHSGVYHVFKEIIEKMLCYDIDGKKHSFIKILFATETFAVGINIPVKATCYTGLSKFSEGNFRLLKPHEYKQMSGRAGRRGMDKLGYSILLPNLYDLPTQSEMTEILMGKSQIIYSRFVPNFQFILKLILTGKDQIGPFIKSSLLNREIVEEEKHLTMEMETVHIPNRDYSKCVEYEELLNPRLDGFIKLSQKMIKKNRKLADGIKNELGFNALYEDYKVDKETIEYRDNLQNNLNKNNGYIDSCILKIITLLKDTQYIIANSNIPDYQNLQPPDISIKGIIASQINECNEIIFTELIMNNYLDNLQGAEIVAILSLFIQSKSNTDETPSIEGLIIPSHLKPHIKALLDISTCFENRMNDHKLYIDIDWSLSLNSIDYMYEWASGADFNTLIQKYGLFPGNFVKDVIKINNIVQDVIKMAGILENPALVSAASNIEQTIIRDCVNMESLYVKV